LYIIGYMGVSCQWEVSSNVTQGVIWQKLAEEGANRRMDDRLLYQNYLVT
jgi:hypothetical protein